MMKKLQEEIFLSISKFCSFRNPCTVNTILVEFSVRYKRLILSEDIE